ncbi:MAG: choice-of-anchor N protein [Planctomycetota bacterium]|jgi:hypothetical protein
MSKSISLIVCGLLLFSGRQTVEGAPALEIYLEGGSFDANTHTWVVTSPSLPGGSPVRLWAIVDGVAPAGTSVFEDVRLAVAYSEKDLGLVISLTPSQLDIGSSATLDGLIGPAKTPVLNTVVGTSLGLVGTDSDGVVANGGAPLLADGTPLSAQGVYGPGTVWQEFSLGDFPLSDTPLALPDASLPTDVVAEVSHVSVYDLTLVGGHGARLHFDLYGSARDQESGVFSSEATVELLVAPEPASWFVWCILGLTWAGSAWMYQYWSRWRRWEEEERLTAAMDVCGVGLRFVPGEAGDLERERYAQARESLSHEDGV